MELKYTRRFVRNEKDYTVGEAKLMFGYAAEVMDPRARMSQGKLEPGEKALILFGITPEEYAWRESDVKSLDELCERLRQGVPRDRLIGFQVHDIKGTPVQREMQLETTETVDDGAFAAALKAQVEKRKRERPQGPIDELLLECRRLQQICADKEAPQSERDAHAAAKRKLGEALCGLDVIFAAYDGLMNARYPVVGFDARVELFTLTERAQAAEQQLCQVNAGLPVWSVKEIAHEGIEAFMRTLEALGITQLRVDNGFASAELTLSDFRPQKAQDEGAELRCLILREIEYGVRWNRLKAVNASEKLVNGALESMLTLRGFVWRNIGNGVLYAVTPDSVPGEGMLCTAAARDKLKDGQWLIAAGQRIAQATNNKTQERCLATFTSAVLAEAFASRIDGEPRPIAMTFDDLVDRAKGDDGILVDMDSFGYRIPATEFEHVRETRAKPPVIVRIQPKQAEEAAPQPAPVDTALPDPDAYSGAVQPQAKEENPASQAPAAQQTPVPGQNATSDANQNTASDATPNNDNKNKRDDGKDHPGFFRRLFRK